MCVYVWSVVCGVCVCVCVKCVCVCMCGVCVCSVECVCVCMCGVCVWSVCVWCVWRAVHYTYLTSYIYIIFTMTYMCYYTPVLTHQRKG